MRRFIKQNSLSIVFLLLFLAALGGQAIAGHADFNEQAIQHGDPEMSMSRYVVSSEFGVDVMENWQSEYLQFSLLILGTVWLLQRGSPESKELDKAGRESDEQQKVGEHADAPAPRWARIGGRGTRGYAKSLLIVVTAIWAAFLGGAAGNRRGRLQPRPVH